MTDPQIINTPAGEEMAVLPLEEYKRLLRSAEELVDIRAGYVRENPFEAERLLS